MRHLMTVGYFPTRLMTCLIGIAIVLGVADVSRGEVPVVQFDVEHTVGCRDVTSPEFAELNPTERLIEVRFQISTFIERGDSNDLIEVLYTIESPRKAFRVVDFEPKTTLDSEYAGNVGFERKKEKSVTLGLGLSGPFPHVASADASTSTQNKTLTTVRYELVPPKELLAASGTIQRGHGVYFKLKPSRRTTFEGAKEFVVVMRVPDDWRADYVHVRCEASANRRGAVYQLHESVRCGAKSFVLALYSEGDLMGRRAAEFFVRRELQLRRAAARHEREIRRRAYPSLADKVGRLLDVASPKIPADWFTEVLNGGASVHEPKFLRYLPGDVTVAARNYTSAKQMLHKLNGRADAIAQFGP